MKMVDRSAATMASSYDDIAEWYDTWVGTHPMPEDPYFPSVESLMGEVAGRPICDLACGQGRVARYLAGRGARVTGVDLSQQLLSIARRHEKEHPLGITYIHADARTLEGVPDASFDGVVCNMALMDIEDLSPALASTARVLRPRGWFVFSILHPCFNTADSGDVDLPGGAGRAVRRYFEERHWRSESRTGPPGKVGAYHRTLSTYINALTGAGLTIERAIEPTTPHPLPDSPSLSRSGRPVWQEVPAVLVLRCGKGTPTR
jgi:2-polyprenyl-3-methyl-5-hydroxy-6-metoxy-1,4-benzoquinol methylase